MLSVTDCLKKGEILPYEIDKFSFVSNTLKRNEGYSSQADKVMYKLSEMYPGLTGISEGYATFSQEACSIAVISIIENAWLIHSGLFKSSLVTASELATTLSHPDDFRNHNLFGDASGSVFLRQGKRKSILATGIKTHPYPTKGDPNKKAIDLISQREDGYLFQDGPEVYKWVNGTFVKELKQSFEEIDFDFTQLDHCIFHQPSYKVTKSLREKIYEQWTGFKGHIYWDKNAGNTSSASTLSLLSRLIESGEIKKGNKVLVSSFGAGLTWAFFIYEY
jgi:3-oxoacyl-[acyl-carrier-protein] synthase-3